MPLTFFYLKYESQTVLNDSLLIWQEPQSGNLAVIMTQTICRHPPVQLAIHLEILPAEQIPVIHGGSAAGMLSRQVFVRFSWIFQLLTLHGLAVSPALLQGRIILVFQFLIDCTLKQHQNFPVRRVDHYLQLKITFPGCSKIQCECLTSRLQALQEDL